MTIYARLELAVRRAVAYRREIGDPHGVEILTTLADEILRIAREESEPPNGKP